MGTSWGGGGEGTPTPLTSPSLKVGEKLDRIWRRRRSLFHFPFPPYVNFIVARATKLWLSRFFLCCKKLPIFLCVIVKRTAIAYNVQDIAFHQTFFISFPFRRISLKNKTKKGRKSKSKRQSQLKRIKPEEKCWKLHHMIHFLASCSFSLHLLITNLTNPILLTHRQHRETL